MRHRRPICAPSATWCWLGWRVRSRTLGRRAHGYPRRCQGRGSSAGAIWAHLRPGRRGSSADHPRRCHLGASDQGRGSSADHPQRCHLGASEQGRGSSADYTREARCSPGHQSAKVQMLVQLRPDRTERSRMRSRQGAGPEDIVSIALKHHVAMASTTCCQQSSFQLARRM